MPKRVSASNAVGHAIEYTCAIYGVPCFRMQSRAFTVIGAGGRSRPMFMGEWKDENGTVRRKGMADYLLTPRIRIEFPTVKFFFAPTVALWVECKSGTGELSADQILFRDYVLKSGAYYIEAHDSADAVVEWFKDHGVTR